MRRSTNLSQLTITVQVLAAAPAICTSNLQTKKDISGNMTELNIDYNDFVSEAQVISKMNE